MDRRSFLLRSLGAVGALTLGRLPIPAPAAPAEIDRFVASDGFCTPVEPYYFLDGGKLDLGIVRDSVLNSTNDYQIFGEAMADEAWHHLAVVRDFERDALVEP